MTLEELQQIENWTNEDYQHSLELLRDHQDWAIQLQDQLYVELEEDVFRNVLNFEAGWPENFNILDERYKIAYQEAFKDI